MKIAFAGVSSTGKTTLSRTVFNRSLSLHDNYSRLNYVHEVLDEAFDWCDKNNNKTTTRDCRKFTDEDKAKFERGMFAAQRNLEVTKSLSFNGGSPLDLIIDSAQLVQMMYLLYFCTHVMDEYEVNGMYNEGMRHSFSYDAVFYVPFGKFPINDDGRRLTNKPMLFAMDGVLRSVLEDAKKQGVNVIEVEAVELEARVNFVMNTIARLRKPQPQVMFNTFPSTPPVAAGTGTFPIPTVFPANAIPLPGSVTFFPVSSK